MVSQPKDPKRSDGKAVRVTAVSDFEKGTLVRKHRGIDTDWYGFACTDAVSGEQVELTIAPYEFEFIVPADIEGFFGQILWFDVSDGEIVEFAFFGDGGEGEGEPEVEQAVPFAKVTRAKDENNVVWGILLPQMIEW